MQVKALSIFLGFLLIGAIGCENKPKPSYELMEYLKVRGECREDHTKVSGNYSGYIVHWTKRADGSSMRYGAVIHWKSLEPEEVFARVKDPYKYRPPLTVSFWGLTKEEIAGNSLKLKGIAEQTTAGEDPKGLKYRATCELSVLERLDHLPPKEQMPSN